jgi:serine protease Do
VKSALRIAVFAAAVAAPSLVSARPAPDSFAELSARLSPAVVNISTSQKIERPDLGEMPQFPPGSPFEELFKDYYENQGEEGGSQVTSLGSGFVIDPSGYIVTNNHVIEGADEITVNFPDGTSLKAELKGKDEKTDLALLKISGDAPFPSVSFGDSNAVQVGDWVLAIGNPFGLGGTVTAGIVSARNRDIDSGPYDDFIQTDAAINRGNSGGPLFDMDGNVVGVNSAIISPSGGSIGIGFAIPSSIVKRVIGQLREFGETRRGWIGVRIQAVTPEIAEEIGLGKARGAMVSEVTPGGPGEASGLRTRDVILRFDGRDVNDSRALPRLVAETEIGKTVQLEVWRDRASLPMTITLGRLEEDEEAAGPASDGGSGGGGGSGETEEGAVPVEGLGLTVSAITDRLRERFSIGADTKGVVITAIEDGTPAGAAAAEGRIRTGDVILEVAQREVASPQEAAGFVKEVLDAGDRVLLLTLSRGGEVSFAAIKLKD